MFSKKRADSPALLPKPYAVAPSGSFDGNDGQWSTFLINIGNSGTSNGPRGQDFRVLISTSSPLTLVPQQAKGCDADCAKERGVEIFNAKQPLGFEPSSSKTWHDEGQYFLPFPNYWWSKTTLRGAWGTDNVGLGRGSPDSLILQSQWVVEYNSEDLYMGSFGLAAAGVSNGVDSRPPFVPNFAGSNISTSSSYGYTAGAVYRNNNKRVLGNLVLGGFDQSRVSQIGTSIPMPPAGNTSLVVGVQSIIYRPDPAIGSESYSFTANRASGPPGFYATIDSTLPYLWLPDDICDDIASRFQLQFDKGSELYKVNRTAHEYNLKQNATVNFKIGNGPQDSFDTTTISLPYAAMYLQAGSPLFPNETNYFPIRKSKNGVFVLGRTFLQEAYIVVDYERHNFTVARAAFSDPMPQENLVPIFKKDYVPPAAASPTTTIADKKGGLAPGAVAGIVVGIVILFLLLGLGAFFFWKKRRATQRKGEHQDMSEIDTMFAETEVKQPHPMSELDSDPQGKYPGGYYSAGGRDNKGIMPFPPVSEMESPPAEMYSPPTEAAQLSATPASERKAGDYFTKVRRRGATRESSGNNTPGTPGITAIHELPGDDVQYQVGGVHSNRKESPQASSPLHSRGPSDTSLATNIDEVISGQQRSDAGVDAQVAGPERRPSHARGASDTTIQSDTTAVSQPTPEEMESWASEGTLGPRRPLSQ